MSDTVAIRNIRCGACGNVSEFRLVEIWRNHTIVFQAKNGARSKEGYMHEGEPHAVFCECEKCGRSWRMRNAGQIISLDLLSERKAG